MSDGLDARSEILTRIRSASQNATELPCEQAWEAIPRDYRMNSTLSRDACIDLLEERLRDYGAGVLRSQPSQLAATIAEILRTRKKKLVAVPLDIDPAWLSESEDGCTFVPDDALSYAEIDSCDGMLTGCTAAIAGTGTLCVCHAPREDTPAARWPGQGRRALTLIPDYHLCVVCASSVAETVPEAMRMLEPYRTGPITLISGPSATSDIEMTRIQGVHGPRVLDVVIVS